MIILYYIYIYYIYVVYIYVNILTTAQQPRVFLPPNKSSADFGFQGVCVMAVPAGETRLIKDLGATGAMGVQATEAEATKDSCS